MNDDRLLFECATQLSGAEALARQVWDAKAIEVKTINLLVVKLRRALCAAVELENRAVGIKPPKIGD